MADEIKSILLEYPNISLKYAIEKNGVYFDEFPELQNGEYAYKLCVGDKLHCIRYRGTNKDICVSPD